MYVCVYIYIYIYTHVYIHTHVRTYIRLGQAWSPRSATEGSRQLNRDPRPRDVYRTLGTPNPTPCFVDVFVR